MALLVNSHVTIIIQAIKSRLLPYAQGSNALETIRDYAKSRMI